MFLFSLMRYPVEAEPSEQILMSHGGGTGQRQLPLSATKQYEKAYL